MVIFAAAALAATLAPQAQARAAPQRQAQATVTILAAARLQFSEIEKTDPKALRATVVRGADGSKETVKLVEFH